ncbi:hypothetical protein [Aneurinibacillus terranovensis]|uniref:hypothetical protein n=1 Tax=Aneurinibacillus terranovensis TaxID=278991 RepID=UPI001FE02F21|nr:hypothetical protein [Aneurinibacillus terranovensis]
MDMLLSVREVVNQQSIHHIIYFFDIRPNDWLDYHRTGIFGQTIRKVVAQERGGPTAFTNHFVHDGNNPFTHRQSKRNKDR